MNFFAGWIFGVVLCHQIAILQNVTSANDFIQVNKFYVTFSSRESSKGFNTCSTGYETLHENWNQFLQNFPFHPNCNHQKKLLSVFKGWENHTCDTRYWSLDTRNIYSYLDRNDRSIRHYKRPSIETIVNLFSYLSKQTMQVAMLSN